MKSELPKSKEEHSLTSVKSVGVETEGKPSFGPINRFSYEHTQKKLYLCIALGSLVLSCVFMLLAIQSNKKDAYVFAIDGTRTFHIGPLQELTMDSPVFSSLAIDATEVIFKRSKTGLNLKERFNKLFLQGAQEIVKEDLKGQMSDIEQQHLRIYPVVQKIHPIKERDGEAYIIGVSGYLDVSGNFDGYQIDRTEEFRIVLAFVPNPNFSENGRYPFVVANLKIKEPIR